MKKILKAGFLLVLLSGSFLAQAQSGLLSPEAFLGYPLGEKFTYHHQIVAYYQHVAAHSDRVSLQPYGATNEGRPLLVAFVTSPENQSRLEEIRTDNLKRAGMVEGSPSANKTAIVWLSYNVHGNEASSSEATMLTLYTLASTTDEQQLAWLENTMVVMDPCINPDGRDRYAQWIRQQTSPTPNVELEAMEHMEPWPGGRPNHYLFDLNRDWAWQTQVESQQRMALYNQWLPHIHVDFHEQGINDPYYFAPAAEPFHKVITPWQRQFQTRIGENHAKYFDAEGWLYFTKERFDLLYPSYGDTYPTFNGGIGMTYEQAGHSRGGLAAEIEGSDTLTLLDRLTHHHTTGLSTVEITSLNAADVVDNFAKFFADGKSAVGSRYKTYVVKTRGSLDEMKALTALLDGLDIDYSFAESGRSISGFGYRQGQTVSARLDENDLIISAYQPKSAMVRVLFEPETELSDSVTYDITAWSLPYVYGLEAYALTDRINPGRAGRSGGTEKPPLRGEHYGYLLPWQSLADAQFLSALLRDGMQVRFSQVPFSQGGVDYPRGSLIILAHDNRNVADFHAKVQAYSREFQRPLRATESGWVARGSDFGSSNVSVLEPPHIAVLAGEETSSLSHGEVWYYFDQVLGYPVTRIDVRYASRVDWSDYDVVVMPNGWYSEFLGDGKADALASWVRDGGTLIAIEGAAAALSRTGSFGLSSKPRGGNDEKKEPNYAERLHRYENQEREYLVNYVPGAIYKVQLDDSHPLAFGYSGSYHSLKTSGQTFEYLENGWNVGVIPNAEAHVSGFVGHQLKKNLAETLVFGVEPMGGGAVVYMIDNPLFRAFWHNGHLFMANAIFMVNK